MNKHSPKRAALELEIKRAKLEVRRERPPICECCQMPPGPGNHLDISHNYPVKHFEWLAADKGNMTLLIRCHHEAWERNRLWEIDIAERLILSMWEMSMNEPDENRRNQMQSHCRHKIIKCSDFPEGKLLSDRLWQKIFG